MTIKEFLSQAFLLNKIIKAKESRIEQLRDMQNERYVCLKRWEDIAADNGYSWNGVHKIHRGALQVAEEYLRGTYKNTGQQPGPLLFLPGIRERN